MTVSALKSMTGFAQARAEHDGWVLRLSLRSVNHRFLDLHMRLPEGFERLESRIRQMVRERLRRGHVDVAMHYEPAGPAAVGVNRDVAAAYLRAAEDLRVQFKMKAEPDLGAILRLPGVIAPPTASLEQDWEQLSDLAANCLREALDRLDQMRQVEGRTLGEELSRRLRHIAERVKEIEGLASRARPAYAKRLETRLKELLSETELDPARLAQEAAIAAERSDVSEELARLCSHVQQFEKILSAGAEAGKKLDFLLQEMQREANTLLSKTPGTEEEGLAMTSLALEVKGEIEKLREQVQNLE
jgi:uncharacterized protein (TIGR00255 family)